MIAEPPLDRVISWIIQVESSGGKALIRHEKHYPWLFKPLDIAEELGISYQAEVAQQRFSYGPMHIIGGTARELGYRNRDLKDLMGIDGIIYGIKYLEKCQVRFPRFPDYVSAFNAGSVRRLPSGVYVNQEYVDKVLSHG